MRIRPARCAGEIGAKHYAAVFGEPPPDKKNGRTSKIIEADRNSKHRTSTVARDVERDKAHVPRRRHDQ